jgi:ferritin-like metal-binding protein YciE
MTSQTARDLFVTGLRNAHAMERQAEELMERQSERTSDYPEVQGRLREHLEETRNQIARLDRCLEACGETASTLKDATLSFMGNMAAMGHAMAGDEILKNTFANNAFEHYEIAAYKSLIALAKEAGIDADGLLRQSLREEEEMAEWIDSHIEDVTLAYLSREVAETA